MMNSTLSFSLLLNMKLFTTGVKKLYREMALRFFLPLVFISSFGVAQNLVPNPGFEQYKTCPYSFSKDPRDFGPTGWSSPTSGTPDYYNKCSIGDNGVPHNWAGVSHSHSGAAYAGIYAWKNRTKGNYREYIQCKLVEPLRAKKNYLVQFYYRLSSYSVYAIDRIGLALSDTAIWAAKDGLLPIEPLFSEVKELQTLTNAWHLASAEITARGGEQFLVIGNFHSNDSTKNMKINFREGKSPMLGGSAYYYIDDVSVSLIHDFVEDSVPDVKTNETYVLKNIQFQFDSYQLLPSSFQELDKLITILTMNPSWKIELTGHTDDQGSEEYNLTLSKQRAKSVGDYLLQKGVENHRVRTQGFGMQKPMQSGRDELARSINRRVEARFFD